MPLRPLTLVPLLVGLILPPRSASAAEPPVALAVKADSAAFSFERVRPAVAESLGLPVVAVGAAGATRGILTVTWRPSRRELAVTYQDAARGVVSRVVPAPSDVETAVATASALAANLVRDDAAELLGPRSPTAPPPAAAAPQLSPTITVAAPAPPPAVGATTRPYRLAAVSLLFPLASNFDEPIGIALHRHFSIFLGTGLTATTRFFELPDDTEQARISAGPEFFAGIQL